MDSTSWRRTSTTGGDYTTVEAAYERRYWRRVRDERRLIHELIVAGTAAVPILTVRLIARTPYGEGGACNP